MAGNHLEQLMAEWYEYCGYFVRRNVMVGPRRNGGYEGELDVVAFEPGSKHLVHVEASMDAYSWAKRETRFRRKFEMGRKYIPNLFAEFDDLVEIEQFAVLGFASKDNHTEVGGCPIRLIPDILAEIAEHLEPLRIQRAAVPEQFSLLRTLQFAVQYRSVFAELDNAAAGKGRP